MALRNPVKYNQARGHELVTPAATLPVTVATLESQLSLDAGAETDFITLQIEMATNFIEELTGLSLITKTYKLTLDSWPNESLDWWDGVQEGAIGSLNATRDVYLPRYPLQSVDTVEADGVVVAVTDSFITDTSRKPGRIALKGGATFPVILDAANGLQITYKAGFGDTPASVPAILRAAVLQLAVYLYTNRGDCDPANAIYSANISNMINTYAAKRL